MGVIEIRGELDPESVLKAERLTEYVVLVVFVKELEVDTVKYPVLDDDWLLEIVELDELDEV